MVRQYCIAPDNSRALAVVLLMINKEYLPLPGYNFSSMVKVLQYGKTILYSSR